MPSREGWCGSRQEDPLFSPRLRSNLLPAEVAYMSQAEFPVSVGLGRN